MTNTQGNLEPARIYEVDKDGEEVKGGISVDCMFNPYEYTISKSNSYSEKPKNAADTPNAEFFKAGAQTLKLNLVFDSYEAKEDVSQKTRKLWDFMLTKNQEESHQGDKVTPPQAAFHWGVFMFVAYITSMTQKFTLFLHDGTPVRAKVDVTFTQYTDVDDYRGKRTNPTSGGGPSERVWRVIAGDRLDIIAQEIYGEATQWRRIAQHNQILDPLTLKPGRQLRIPLDRI
ncbi:MAG: LysM peptidoglycan-binding domain-containing protein [Anaerolineae bacterium]|nr:LysM peptidoglycan-binding domain-containing protein [Anaerolineae bacterium]